MSGFKRLGNPIVIKQWLQYEMVCCCPFVPPYLINLKDSTEQNVGTPFVWVVLQFCLFSYSQFSFYSVSSEANPKSKIRVKRNRVSVLWVRVVLLQTVKHGATHWQTSWTFWEDQIQWCTLCTQSFQNPRTLAFIMLTHMFHNVLLFYKAKRV